MNKLLSTALIIFLSFGLVAHEAEAKRLGGGKSTGMQRESVSSGKPAAAPAQQAAAPAQAAGAAAAQAPKRNWMGPLAGLAAGLGIAALLSHFGMGAGLANFVMILLLVVAAVVVFKLIFRKKAEAAQPEPMQYAGVGGPSMGPIPTADPLPPGSPVPGVSPLAPVAQAAIPADFDVEAFVRVAKVQFVRMQAAHDSGNLEDIREFTTPEMFAEIKMDIDERHGAQQHTDVVTVNAEVLEVASEATRHVASVRFRGTIRETVGAEPVAFDEVWNLVKPSSGATGWILAGVQQLS